ncbi:MAG: hypothetical protein GY869_28115, partial [Planctomycetes bacterium]|nr:hypothetical protein [Planctomycetota bacterium]
LYATKLASDGDYGWTISCGGDYLDKGQAIALDDTGNIFITGSWGSVVDFDFTTDQVDNRFSAGRRDIFVTKINADKTYGWTTSFGSSFDDYSNSIAVDTDGNPYFTGSFYKTVDFDPSDNVDRHSATGFSDAFVTKLKANGDYGWTATFGSTEPDAGMKKMKTGQFAPGHNVQSTVDLETGAIIVLDVVEQAN